MSDLLWTILATTGGDRTVAAYVTRLRDLAAHCDSSRGIPRAPPPRQYRFKASVTVSRIPCPYLHLIIRVNFELASHNTKMAGPKAVSLKRYGSTNAVLSVILFFHQATERVQ